MKRTFAGGGVADPDLLTVGESTMHRRLVVTLTAAVGSGTVRLTYFTARKSETVTQLRIPSGATAAGATPTMARAGVYSVATDGALTLVGAIANDTTLFAAANTPYTRTLTTPFAKVAGQRYAFGMIVVTAATAPTFCGNVVLHAAEAAIAPRLAASVFGQTDLPASVAVGSIGDGSNLAYAVLLP